MGMKEVKGSKEYNFEKLVYRVMWAVAIIVFSAIGLYWGHFGSPVPLSSLGTITDFGAFGDFFGGITNPLLQFIVIAMLFWSIQVQRQELKATRDTLEATKIELSETKTANNKQALELEKQTFILRTQQQDNLDQIKVAQELSILGSQKELLEHCFCEHISELSNSPTIQEVINSNTPVGNDYFLKAENNSYERKLSANISLILHQLSMSLCALLESDNIPVTATTIEVQYFGGNLYKLVKAKVVKKGISEAILSKLNDKICQSTLDIQTKEILEDLINIKH